MSQVGKAVVEYDEQIDEAPLAALERREDVFVRGCTPTDALRWTVVRDAQNRAHFQLRKKAEPRVCYIQLAAEDLDRYSDEDLVAMIIQRERPCVDAGYLSQRVDRWAQRLQELFARVRQWLADCPGWTPETAAVRQREEELLARWGVPPRDVPVLTLRAGDRFLRFLPDALFIVGANGRVDLLDSGKRTYILVDRAPDDQPQRDWQVAIPEARQVLRPFTANVLHEILDRTG